MPTLRIENAEGRARASTRPSVRGSGGPRAHWGDPPACAVLDVSHVHVWMARLATLGGDLARLRAVLDGSEQARAGRYRFSRDRNRFILGRGLLRLILGRYLGRSPQSLRFEYSAHGKPFVEGTSSDGSLQFNLSHSAGVALIAVAAGRRVGVDVERIRPERATTEIAERFFAPEDTPPARLIGSVPSHDHTVKL